MDINKYIEEKYKVDLEQKMPIKLGISRFKGFIEILREAGFKVGAEIGVATGRYSKWLCAGIPDLKLFLVDPYTAYSEYVEHHDDEGQKILNDCYVKAQERVAKYNCEFVRKPSMDALKDFNDNSLDFVFIDGNHSFQYVVNDIAEWSKKVKPGGIVAGHDFWRSTQVSSLYVDGLSPREKVKLCQVKDAVEGWTYANQIKPWFVATNDKCPAWFYVKR